MPTTYPHIGQPMIRLSPTDPYSRAMYAIVVVGGTGRHSIPGTAPLDCGTWLYSTRTSPSPKTHNSRGETIHSTCTRQLAIHVMPAIAATTPALVTMNCGGRPFLNLGIETSAAIYRTRARNGLAHVQLAEHSRKLNIATSNKASCVCIDPVTELSGSCRCDSSGSGWLTP